MSELIETYKGINIRQCSWGYCVGNKHFGNLATARSHIEREDSRI